MQKAPRRTTAVEMLNEIRWSPKMKDKGPYHVGYWDRVEKVIKYFAFEDIDWEASTGFALHIVKRSSVACKECGYTRRVGSARSLDAPVGGALWDESLPCQECYEWAEGGKEVDCKGPPLVDFATVPFHRLREIRRGTVIIWERVGVKTKV